LGAPARHSAALRGLVAAWALLLLLGSGARVAAVGTAGERWLALAPVEASKGAGSQARVLTYTYDGAGRLNQADYGGGSTLTYVYDATGNLVRVSPGGGVELYLPLAARQTQSRR